MRCRDGLCSETPCVRQTQQARRSTGFRLRADTLLCIPQVPLLKRRGQHPPSNLVHHPDMEPSFEGDFVCDEASLFVLGVGYGSLAKARTLKHGWQGMQGLAGLATPVLTQPFLHAATAWAGHAPFAHDAGHAATVSQDHMQSCPGRRLRQPGQGAPMHQMGQTLQTRPAALHCLRLCRGR